MHKIYAVFSSLQPKKILYFIFFPNFFCKRFSFRPNYSKVKKGRFCSSSAFMKTLHFLCVYSPKKAQFFGLRLSVPQSSRNCSFNFPFFCSLLQLRPPRPRSRKGPPLVRRSCSGPITSHVFYGAPGLNIQAENRLRKGQKITQCAKNPRNSRFRSWPLQMQGGL